MVAECGRRVHLVGVVSFAPSSRYEGWITALRQPWMRTVGRRIWGAFAAALGDKALDWGTQVNLEHLPRYASAPSVVLTASERQLDTFPGEGTAALADRAPQWMTLGRFAGSPLGLLLGLHFSGFDGAVVVQQNGRAFQLTLPLPPFVDGVTWDPTGNQVITSLSPLATVLTSNVTPPSAWQAGRSIPAGQPWWALDSDTDFCSRFSILFPGPLPSYFMTCATAQFTESDTATVAWNNAFADLTYSVRVDGVTAPGGELVAVNADSKAKTLSGVTLRASAPFTGTVDVVAYQACANPLADLHPADLKRLQTLIRKWGPRKATCTGVYALVQGKFMAWPVQLQAANTMGPATIVRFPGA